MDGETKSAQLHGKGKKKYILNVFISLHTHETICDAKLGPVRGNYTE